MLHALLYVVCIVFSVRAGIYKLSIGKPGGGTHIPMKAIREIGLRADKYVNQIRLNGNSYGQNSGKDRGLLIMEKDEYIVKIHYREGNYIDNLEFWTNKGRYVGGGGNGGAQGKLENIRVIAIGGRSGQYVDMLDIMYMTNYQPSKLQAKNLGLILSYTPPFGKFKYYTRLFEKTTESYIKVLESMDRTDYDSNIESEFIFKAAVYYGFEVEAWNLETFRTELERQLEHKQKRTEVIPEGYIGVKLANGELFKRGNGTFWMFPTSGVSASVIKISDAYNMLGQYDLTGMLYTQMPGLKKNKRIRNGYVYYDEPNEEAVYGTSLNGASQNVTCLCGTSLNKTSVEGTSSNGTSLNGTSLNATSPGGTTLNETPVEGTSENGTSVEGPSSNGTPVKGTSSNGTSLNGESVNVTSPSGTTLNETSLEETSLNGTSVEGTSSNETSLNGESLNATSPSGTTLNITPVEGTTENGTPVKGTSSNVTSSNGTSLNGASLNATSPKGTTLKQRPDSTGVNKKPIKKGR